MFLYEDLLALPGQLVLGGFVQVDLHTPLLLQQTSLSLTKARKTDTLVSWLRTQKSTPPARMWTTDLLHVLGDRVLLQELCALACVETFCVSQKLTFKILLVDGERGSFGEGVLFVQTQLN